MSTGSTRAVALALVANGGIAVSKFGVFLLTGSSSLLTEAIHSSADCANPILRFIGLRQGARPTGPKQPLGHGQAAFVASFRVPLLLFTVGGLFSLVEGIHKIRHPEQPHQLGWAIGLLLFAIALEGWSLRGALMASESERRISRCCATSAGPAGRNWWWCWRRTSPPCWVWSLPWRPSFSPCRRATPSGTASAAWSSASSSSPWRASWERK